jgi:E3 SUMO-protein ligase RanBP2
MLNQKIATATSQKVTEIAKPEPTKKDDKKGFGDLFKVKEGSWKCDGCLMSNSGDILKCPACETLKPEVKKEDVKDTGKSVFGSGASTISFGEKGGFSFGASSRSNVKLKPLAPESGLFLSESDIVGVNPAAGLESGLSFVVVGVKLNPEADLESD